MSNLVKILRQMKLPPAYNRTVILEAADRIEELEADCEALSEQANEVNSEYAKVSATIERVRGLPEKWRNRHKAYEPCADELEEALK